MRILKLEVEVEVLMALALVVAKATISKRSTLSPPNLPRESSTLRLRVPKSMVIAFIETAPSLTLRNPGLV